MSGDFKILFKLDNTRDKEHLWMTGCPLMVEAFQLIRNTNTSDAYLQVKVRNVSSYAVERYELQASITYEGGDTEQLSMTVIDGDVLPGGADQPAPAKLSKSFAVSAAISVKELSLASGEKWQMSPSGQEVSSIAFENLLLSDKASGEREFQLREHGLPAAELVFKVASHGESWRCSCGQPNLKTDSCISCGAGKEMLLALEDEADLGSSADERSLRENAEKQRRSAEKQKRKRIKRIVIAVVAVVVVVGAALGIAVRINSMPGEYQVAMDVKTKTQIYKEAAERFEKLGPYRDSAQQAEICRALDKAYSAAFRDGNYKFSEAEEILEPYRGDPEVDALLDSIKEAALKQAIKEIKGK